MRIKTALAAIAFAVLPGLAAAQCGHDAAQQQAMSCAEGSQWNAQTGTCEPTSTS